MRVGFCGEHILPQNDPRTYCFSSFYTNEGVFQTGAEPCYGELHCSQLKYDYGNVVGCGIDSKRMSYFFTLNGRRVSKCPQSSYIGSKLKCDDQLVTMTNDKLLRRRLYPFVTFTGRKSFRIRANFQGPFKYNLL